jgi:hypothetical protein
MRIFSANVKLLLQQEEVLTFYLVKIETTSSTLLDTTAAYPINIPALGTFSPSNGLLTVEPPKLSSVVDREVYKLIYIDPEFEKIALFEAILTGSKATVYVGFFNSTTTVLGGALPNEPLTNLEDLIVAYEGVVDTQGYAIEPSAGTVVAAIECSSPVASLGLIKHFTTSKNEMQQINPNDTSFDQIYTGSSKVRRLWGKA